MTRIILDILTFPSQDHFLCEPLHLINQQLDLSSQVIAFRYIPGNLSSKKIAIVLEDILKEYQIEKRILTITKDNASNKVLDELIKKVLSVMQKIISSDFHILLILQLKTVTSSLKN